MASQKEVMNMATCRNCGEPLPRATKPPGESGALTPIIGKDGRLVPGVVCENCGAFNEDPSPQKRGTTHRTRNEKRRA